MEISANQTLGQKFKSTLTGKDYFVTKDGVKVTADKGTSKVEVDDNNVVKVYGGEKVSIYGTKRNDKIFVSNAFVKYIAPKKGDNQTVLDNCKYKKYSRFWGTGSKIVTGGYNNYKKGSDVIKINGDFCGGIFAQQGSGEIYGDKKAHKDVILINGSHYGYINIDSHDKIAIKGEKKGKIINTSMIIV